jgi:RNA polymerase sigma factor (TIGR02999 family)
VTDFDVQSGDLAGVGSKRLLTLYYHDLRKIAARILRNDGAVVLLQATELAHETAMRLMKLERMQWNNVPHFLATAARVARQALVDEVRRASAGKRQNVKMITMWPDAAPTDEGGVDIQALDRALTKLEAISPERARVVELRFFSGMTVAEIAQLQGVSERTIMRQWQVARIWLNTEVGNIT